MTRMVFLALGLAAAPALAQAQTTPAPTPANPAPTTASPTTAAPATGAAPQAGTAASTPTVGATVYDTAGATVGTIAQVTPQSVVVDTGTNKVAVPPTSVGPGAKGLQMAMTKAQLDAAAAQNQASMASKIVAGAQVKGASGSPVGTIKTVEPGFVTVTTAKGDVRLPANAVGARPDGVYISLTAEQLDAAMAQSKPAPAPSK